MPEAVWLFGRASTGSDDTKVKLGCFRHQVLLRRDRHVHDRSSGPPAQFSEHPHVA